MKTVILNHFRCHHFPPPHGTRCTLILVGHFLLKNKCSWLSMLTSRFPEVDIMRSTLAAAIVTKLDWIFATHGIPMILCSNNGPPFSSYEIKRYMREKGIKHKKITSLWPQTNSEAEGFMKPLTKTIRLAHTEGKQWRNHQHEFLLNYRTTPHVTIGHPPATLLFNRSVCNKLPQITPTVSDKDHQVRERDQKAEDNMKRNAGTKRTASR